MLNVILHGFVLAAAVSCQQGGDRREAAGEVAPSLSPPPVTTTDADVRAAQADLAEGRAWAATRRAMPVLRTAERRTPEAVIVAARAAAAWGGWTLVEAMLSFEPWLDTRFSGEGRELLARAALERGDAAKAREHAQAALLMQTSDATRAFRELLLARALDRLDERDSSAVRYRRAADGLPLAGEWLLLRAAGVTRETAERKRLYARVKHDAAKGRVEHTEAQALERFGMLLAAADAYEKLDDMASAYRLRLTAATEPSARAALRSGLLRYIQSEASGGSLARAIEVLDAAFPDLDATSQLLVARRAAEGGLSGRAASGFARSPANLLTDRDHIAWARASIATGRNTEAARRIGDRRFGAGGGAVAEARYLRGLALVRAGSRAAARGALDRVIRLNAGTPWAADATYLLADMESDAGSERRARDLHQSACTQARPGSFSDNACFRAGILSFALGDPRRAATAFDALPRRFPSSPEVMAALYWSGRAHARAGNAAVARERWTAAMQREPLSYYAVTSARRLETKNWTPAVTPGPLPRDASIDVAMTRAARLNELGMTTEERHEYDEVERDVAENPDLALAAGAAFLDRGQVPRAIRVGWRAVAHGRARGDSAAADERAYRIVYPMIHEAEFVARSREHRLDPALVAAVIRQESQWFPRALSVAGARGLMQVMPSVGEAIARSRNYPVWDPALLFDPHVSLELGTSHLRAALSQYSSLPRALAAYNAGGSRVRRWAQRVGASDPELFTERIPFVETRDYVRIVQRNAELYRALYGLER